MFDGNILEIVNSKKLSTFRVTGSNFMVIDVTFVENLEDISIDGTNITKLFDIRLAKKLKKVNLYLNEILCFDSLKYATSLQEISICSKKIKNFTFLEKLNNFRRINISTIQKEIKFPQILIEKYKNSILKMINTSEGKIEIVKDYKDLTDFEKNRHAAKLQKERS